ncbi:polyprenal reductase-like [Saccoglossus kowalevskii]
MAASLLIWYWGVCILGFMLTFYSYFNISMPKKLREFLMYGKVRSKGQPSTLEQYLDVPKRLIHRSNKPLMHVKTIIIKFSIFAKREEFFLSLDAAENSISSECKFSFIGKKLNNTLLYFFCEVKVSHVSVFIAMCMIVFQGTRRFLECQFISKTSSKMNVIHYLLGMTFYPCLGPSVLAEGPPLSQAAPFSSVKEMGYYIEYRHILGIVLFLWASYHQYTAGVIFAALRKSASGKLTSFIFCIMRLPDINCF